MQQNITNSSEQQQNNTDSISTVTAEAPDLILPQVEKASTTQERTTNTKQDSPPLYKQQAKNFRGIEASIPSLESEALPITSFEQLCSLLKLQINDQNELTIDGRKYVLQLKDQTFGNKNNDGADQKKSVDSNATTDTNKPLERQDHQLCLSSNSDKTADQLPLLNSDVKQITAPKIDFAQIMQGFQFDTPGEFDDLLMVDSDTDQQLSETSKNQIVQQTTEIMNSDQQNESSKIQNIKTSENNLLKVKAGSKTESQNKSSKQSSHNAYTEEELPYLKKHFSEAVKAHFILSKTSLTMQFPQQISSYSQNMVNTLKTQVTDQNTEISKLKETISQISQCLARIYSSPQLLQKDIEDKELIKVLSQGFLAQAKLHLAFLFSSPLILKYKDDTSGQLQSQTMMSIDHQKELQGVKSSLQETGNQIRYRKIPATLDNLRMSLTENPCALHFSGHGIENSKENFGKESVLLKNEGNFLIFEDQEGCAQYLSEKKLHQLLEASGTKLEFVFVASCYSQFAGEIFHNAGAKHVICVQRGSKISDEASILFSRSFYHALFSQTVTVCQAFAIAKATLSAEKDKFIATECHKFVLIKDSDETECGPQNQSFNQFQQPRVKKHKCTVFGPFSKGEIQNVATEPMFKLEVSRIDDFLGRRKEMQEIISYVMNNRLITIKGIPGIGKTTLAKSAAYFLDERHSFKDGIILISLRGIDQTTMFLTHLFLVLKKNMACLEKDIEEKALEDSKNILEYIINFLKDKNILLVLDNAEDVLRAEANQFRDSIQKLLVQSPGLTILVTSQLSIGSLDEISEKIMLLKELTPHFSIELLFRKAMRPITDQEIADLLKMTEPARVLHSNPLRASKHSMRLDEHHMTQLLGGHPHAISLAAPMLQDKSLKELYAMLNSNEIMDWLRIQGIEGTPLASLKVSLDASIEHMQEHYPKAIKLFCLIGLLPGGCGEEDLDILWGPGWKKYSELLLRASLLVKKTKPNIHYTLLPFMNKYAEDLLEVEERIEMHKKCCNYFAGMCKSLSQQNSNYKLATAQNMNDVINQLVYLETNIWACIYRMVDKKQENQDYSRVSSDYQRGKSPAPNSVNKSLAEDQNFNKTQDDSSQAGNSKDEYDTQDENYGQILCTRRKDGGRRSISEKATRSIVHENNDSRNNDSSQAIENSLIEEQKTTEENNKIESDFYQENKTPQINTEQVHSTLVKLAYIKRLTYAQPQCLAQSLEERKYGDEQKQFGKLLDDAYSNEHLATELASESYYESNTEIETVYPTKGCANLLSDDQYNLSSRSPSIIRKHQSAAVLDVNSINEGNDVETSSHGYAQIGDEIYQRYMKESTNEELQTTYQGQQTRIAMTISQQRLSQLPLNKSLFQKQTDELSATSSIQLMAYECLETSSVESLEYQISAIGNQFENNIQQSNSNQLNQSWNKSMNLRRYSIKNNVALHLVEEIPEEASVLLDEESKLDDIYHDSESRIFCDISSTIEEEVHNSDECKISKLQKKISSKKYYEDDHQLERISQSLFELGNVQHFNQNIIETKEQPQENNQQECTNLVSESTILKENTQQNQQQISSHDKKQKKKVTYQLTEDQVPKNKIRSRMEESKKRNQQYSNYKNVSSSEFTPEGALLVYYISNLVLLHKYSDAINAIEQFGLKLNDPLCEANFKKLQGLLLTFNEKQLKESIKKFDESCKIFQRLDNDHGQALCNLAIGYFYYTKSTQLATKLENENQLFKKAEKRLEEALIQYQRIQHYMGEAQCHKILGLIRQKMNKNYRNHYQQCRILMKKDSDLQKIGKSMFIQRNQIGLELSLFIEIIENQQIHLNENARRRRQQSEKEQLEQSQINITNNNIQAVLQQKDQQYMTTSKSDKNLKGSKASQIPKIQPLTGQKAIQLSNSQIDLKIVENDALANRKITNDLRKHANDSLRQSIQGKEQKELEQITEYNPQKQHAGYQTRRQNDKRFPPQVQKDFSQKPAPKQVKQIPRINIQSIEHQVLSSDNDNRPSLSIKKQQTKVDAKKKDQEIKQYVNSRNAKIQSARESQMSASFLTPSNHLLDIPFQKKPNKKKEQKIKDSYKKSQDEERIFEQAADCSLSETYKSDSENSCSKYDSINFNESSMHTSLKNEGKNTSGSKQTTKGPTNSFLSNNQENRSSFAKAINNNSTLNPAIKNNQSKIKRHLEGNQNLRSLEPKTQQNSQQLNKNQEPQTSNISSVTTVAIPQANSISTKQLQPPTKIQKSEKVSNTTSRAQSPRQVSKKTESSSNQLPAQTNSENQKHQQQPHAQQQQKVKFNITATFTVEGEITNLDQSNLKFNIDATSDAPP